MGVILHHLSADAMTAAVKNPEGIVKAVLLLHPPDPKKIKFGDPENRREEAAAAVRTFGGTVIACTKDHTAGILIVTIGAESLNNLMGQYNGVFKRAALLHEWSDQ